MEKNRRAGNHMKTQPEFQRRGGVTPWVVLSLFLIVAVLALGMDGGRMMEERRHAQSAADAAALAAATQLYTNSFQTPASVTTAADNSAALNGYTNDGVNSIITVHNPPTSGSFVGKSEYVEVIVQRNLKATFGAVITGGPLVIKARAVARGQPAKIGLMALNQSKAGAFTNNSLAAFAVLGTPIIVNSSDPAAFQQNGLIAVIASSIQITGGLQNKGGALMIANIDTGVEPSPDPLARLPLPDPALAPVRSAATLNINSLLPTILQPGVYQGGINIKGASIVTMSPGTYIMDGGGFQMSGLSSLIGLGAVIYNTSVTQMAGPISFNTTGAVTLTPPLNGTYQGFTILQDRTLNQPVSLTGHGVTVLAGAVYAPGAPVTLTGLAAVGVDTLGGAIIADTITVGGIGNVNVSLGANRIRAPDVSLVE
jgi:putative Flp pilus-assembly TadE/G-like protein